MTPERTEEVEVEVEVAAAVAVAVAEVAVARVAVAVAKGGGGSRGMHALQPAAPADLRVVVGWGLFGVSFLA